MNANVNIDKDEIARVKMNAMKMKESENIEELHDMGKDNKDEMMMKAMKMNAMKMPIRSMKMNAMKLSEPMKKMDDKDTENPKKDADMSKVKDKQKPLMAMMKKEKYLPIKPGSIQAVVAEMQLREEELVEVKGKELEKMIADYLRKGGTIKKLPPVLAKGMKPSQMKPHEVGKMGVIKSMKMKEVREFIDTYNKHFLLNYKAEEFINEIQ
tara:strand:+ start:47 stop:679 length:633 start_codon:yes stop_codon:yes gene_type:complete